MTAAVSVPPVVDWRAIEDAIREWFETSSGLQTIWEDQRAPQPSYPYASLNRLPGSSAMPVKSEQIQKADGSIALRRQLDFTVSCQIHVGPPGATTPECHARSLIDTAVAHLDTPGQSEKFEDVGLGLRGPLGEPEDLDLEIGGEWISRSRVDIRFGVASVLQNVPATQPGWFDKVELSSRISGLKTPGIGDGPAPLDLDEEILDPANP